MEIKLERHICVELCWYHVKLSYTLVSADIKAPCCPGASHPVPEGIPTIKPIFSNVPDALTIGHHLPLDHGQQRIALCQYREYSC